MRTTLQAMVVFGAVLCAQASAQAGDQPKTVMQRAPGSLPSTASAAPAQSAPNSGPRSPIQVPGAANIFGAGHAVPPAPGGDGAGQLPTLFYLPPGPERILQFFNITGAVSCCGDPPASGPEGMGSGCDIASWGGISGIVHNNRQLFLAGVFLDDSEPADPAPARLDCTADDFLVLPPRLRQTFFIGDGLTGTGSGQPQSFVAPAGATRLYLGFADAYAFDGQPGWYGDNLGALAIGWISVNGISFGACCLSGGVCVPDMSGADCLAQGGQWQGAGSTCDPNPCPQPVAVPATANVFGAGHAVPPAPDGGGEGVLPTLFNLPSGVGRVMTVSGVSGTVSCCEGGLYPNGPDGLRGAATNVSSWGGISGIVHSDSKMFLAGVFLDDSEPADPAPPRLDFTDNDSFAVLAPQLAQTFFIGDGLTGTGSGGIQRFTVPDGATRLYLGFADEGWTGLPGYYGDNTGELIIAYINVGGVPRGACCCPAIGTCSVTTRQGCLASSGAYLGDGTICGLDTCQAADTCGANSPLISVLPYQTQGTTTGYSNDYDEACPSGGSTAPDVTYHMHFGSPTTVDITLCQAITDYDTKLYVYRGSCPGPLIACSDDDCSSPLYPHSVSRLIGVSLAANTDYWIIVDGYGNASGSYQIDVTETGSPPPPACPESGSPFCQPAAPPEYWQDAYASDTDFMSEWTAYDNFVVPSRSAISDVHWWGSDLSWDGHEWWECDLPTPAPFIITFYNDDGTGAPDLTYPVATYTDILATRTYAGQYGSDSVWYYACNLSPPFGMSTGWISIEGNAMNGCLFYWLNSNEGYDMWAWQYDHYHGMFEQLYTDLGFYLTSSPEKGACCIGPQCYELTAEECANEGGEWIGGSCEPNPCAAQPVDYEVPKHDPPGSPDGCDPCCCDDEDDPIDPVYLFSGEFYENAVDMRIPGRGLDFNWTRKYRSKIGPDTVMGNGWDFSYNIRLERQGTDLRLYDGDSRQDVFVRQPDDTYARNQFFLEGQEQPDGSIIFMFPSTGTWRFRPLDCSPAAGKIDAIGDRNGNELHFQYDSAGRLAAVIDTLNRSIVIGYNADGFISSITGCTGRQVRYEYYRLGEAGGSFGDLKSVTTPAVTGTPNGNDFPDGKTTIYTYSTGLSDNRLNHNLLTVTDPSGQTYLTNVYASTTDPQDLLFDRVVRQVWGDPGDIIDVVYVPQTPAAENNFAVIQVIMNDRVGNVKEFFYDAGNHGVIRREYTGRADPDQPTTETENRPTNKLRPGDPDCFETRYEYNADSKLVRTLHPEGNVTLNVYEEDLDPNAPRRSRGNLREIHHQPGPRGGDQTEIIEYFEYDTGFGGCCGTNFVTRAVDGRGHETLHQYDTHGNRVHTTHRIPEIVEEWEYNAFGQMTAHVLPDNGSGHRRRDETTYYAGGPQTGYLYQSIVDAGGCAMTTTFEYDAVGNLIRQIDPRGHDTLYAVNQLNQVVRETSREVTNGSGIRYQQDTYYDANDNVVRRDVLNVDETGTVGLNAYWTTITEYEILNQPVRRTREVDEGYNVVTEYQYDANRNQTLVRYGEAVDGHQLANVVQTLYDERDSIFRILRAPGDPLQSTTQFDYNGNGNCTLVKAGLESEPRDTLNEYDGYDRLVRLTDPMGNVTSYHYDANGNRVSTRIDGELNDVAGSAGNVRLYESTITFDALDRVIQITLQHFDPQTQAPIGDGAAVTQTFYSGTSQVVRTVNDNGHQQEIAHDTANRQHIVTDAAGNEVEYAYDANSNVIQRVSREVSDLGSPLQTFTTQYSYDNLDRLIQTIDSSGNVIQQSYDSRHDLTLLVDAAGHATRNEYDGLSRLLRTIRDMNGDGPDASDPVDIVTTQGWDDDSRLSSQGDDNGHVTMYIYDALNRSTQTTYADSTAQTTTYDVHDNVLSATDANGSIVTNAYDLLNRRTSRSIVPGPGVSADTTFESYHYDGLSRLVYAQDDDSLVTRTYDSLSNLNNETLDGQAITSVYDGVGNQLQCTYPGGRGIDRTYDALERVQTVAKGAGPTIAAYAYVGPTRVERRTYGNGTRTDYQHDGLTGVPNPPNDFGVQRIIRTTHTKIADGIVIDDRTYTWDRTYNKTQRNDVRAGGPQLTHDYTYDPIDRLIHTHVTGPGGGVVRDEAYELDGVGNRTQVAGGSAPGLYTMDPTLPEPADFQVNQYTGTPFQERRYDRNGNLVADGSSGLGDLNCDGVLDESDVAPFVLALVDPAGYETQHPDCNILHADCYGDDSVNGLDVDGLVRLLLGQWPELRFHISYDYRNQTVEFHDSYTGQRHLYGYDPLGRRIRKVVDADGVAGGPTETRYFYDGSRIVEEQDSATPSSHTLATYVHGRYIDEVLAMRRDVDQNGAPEDYYFHTDDLYNVMAVTDAAGNVVEPYEYGDYGQPEFMNGSGLPISQSAIHNAFLFTGREYDSETGWYNYRTRYLDPVAGRFTTRDTIGLWGDDANLGNGYSLVANGPTGFTDAFGMSPLGRLPGPPPPEVVLRLAAQIQAQEPTPSWPEPWKPDANTKAGSSGAADRPWPEPWKPDANTKVGSSGAANPPWPEPWKPDANTKAGSSGPCPPCPQKGDKSSVPAAEQPPAPAPAPQPPPIEIPNWTPIGPTNTTRLK